MTIGRLTSIPVAHGYESERQEGSARSRTIDIGRETRLELYRLQLELRYCEKRAYDLFLQNLVKGTSHLSLGQEAIAAAFGVAMRPDDWTFCTYRGHAHTLARGASMAGVLGELMGRQCGLLGGKGGSMHLTDVEQGRDGLLRDHRRAPAGGGGRRVERAVSRHRAGRGVLLRRRHDQHRRVPRGAQLLGGVEAAGGLRVREQSLHGVHADQLGDGGRASGGGPRAAPTAWRRWWSTATTPTRCIARR